MTEATSNLPTFEPTKKPSSIPPIVIHFMVVCAICADPINKLGRNHWESAAGRETRHLLQQHGLIDDKHEATEKGRAWLKMICQTPVPSGGPLELDFNFTPIDGHQHVPSRKE